MFNKQTKRTSNFNIITNKDLQFSALYRRQRRQINIHEMVTHNYLAW